MGTASADGVRHADPSRGAELRLDRRLPELHNFCATDLSAFYFDVRKDAIYCDRPDSLRRRAARTCSTTCIAA